MRRTSWINVLAAGILVAGVGCGPKNVTVGPTAQAGGRLIPVVFTDETNPTTKCGRGEPSLDDQFRPAAWVYIDGEEGRFIERDGHPQLQWVIDGPVSRSPTFRVGIYEPLVGIPKDFKCVLQTIESVDGSDIRYGILTQDGKFEIGKSYSLLRPGDEFIIRNLVTGDIVREFPPLAPGRYAFAAAVGRSDSKNRAAAVTFFTVGEQE